MTGHQTREETLKRSYKNSLKKLKKNPIKHKKKYMYTIGCGTDVLLSEMTALTTDREVKE